MASYAQDVKNELARLFDDDKDCLRAELLALLTVGTKKIDGRIEFSSSNAAVARKVITLFKKFFPKIKPEVVARRRKKLRKDLSYVVRIFLADEVQTFLAEVYSPEFLNRDQLKVAYLRGAFLATGTVNRPETQYFLEMSSRNPATIIFIRNLLETLEFRAGFYQRKKFFVVWVREADSICDFLGMVGANDAVERFEIARNVKEIRKQVNYIVNLETAALNTAVDAAQRQIADIKILLANKIPLNDRIKEVAKVRLENPSCTVDELAEKLHITYDTLRGRLRRINQLARSAKN